MNIIRKLLAPLALWSLLAPLAALAQQPQPPSPEKLFDPIASVLQHPRCLNCHMAEKPFQKDAQVPHAQMIVRGADGKGAPTMRCAACHQDKNSADGRVPGAPHWHLAPTSMAWEGLSRAQLCRSIKDPAKNGNRQTMAQVIDHMKVDPLVLWAWNPGDGRSTPSLSHADFVKALETWAAAGGACSAGAK
ncbi:hypothetical protein [Paucibacter sp. XJ19-41]|uniref:hypothetical protein n=1 Tax=Paucibacter sp. XJ19-41 TaxID=2927824 RepID=UPI00234A9DF8|nr:hypothetical protein [Paucibacter sp. XJ19-41]MDC6166667.1 hypothetical protein [Paucibacter sp. XJ19-41]